MRGENSERDRELDAALASYAAVEPRAGLEQRVLANLRAKRQDNSARGRWRWPVLATLAVAVSIVVVSPTWRTVSKAFHAATAPRGASRQHVASASEPAIAAQNNIDKPGSGSEVLQERAQSAVLAKSNAVSDPIARELPQTERSAGAAPKLDRFPAPEALSEQEKLLVRFVEDDPQEAVLVAEAQAAQLQREDEEIEKLRNSAQPEQAKP
ncbi:MAG TPA: hypothetical protein VEJ38_06870 [Candidatus Acidoferrales bacterium]|nr:hypothetical protein [Candidatus Acidoferrales bacterium]